MRTGSTSFALSLAVLALSWTMTAQASDSGHAHHGAHADRQKKVEQLGAMVMPFDLDRSLHVFEKASDGGTQAVISKDRDAAQIALIREHLKKEAAAFARGDFSDPAAIHGHDMPGLSDLRAGAGRIQVIYQELPDGARLRYVTDEDRLVQALHAWFAAQLHDHGGHATTHPIRH